MSCISKHSWLLHGRNIVRVIHKKIDDVVLFTTKVSGKSSIYERTKRINVFEQRLRHRASVPHD